MSTVVSLDEHKLRKLVAECEKQTRETYALLRSLGWRPTLTVVPDEPRDAKR